MDEKGKVLDLVEIGIEHPDDIGKTREKEEDEIDRYDIDQIDFADTGPAWKDMSRCDRAKRVLIIILGLLFALALLYIFICSLDLLQGSFQLLGGKVAGTALSNNVILSNPLAGLMLGVLTTVLVQSSSTSTSIFVSLVAADVLLVRQAIYLIMGANIGTSVTNTIVSLGQSGDKETFRRAFAGATVHDMFNWLTVVILLPLEAASGYLYRLTYEIVKTIDVGGSGVEKKDFLKVITKPLITRIIKIDKKVFTAAAEGTDKAKYPVCQYYCTAKYDHFFESWPLGEENNTFIQTIKDQPWTIKMKLANDTNMMTTNFTWSDINHDKSKLCTHHFTGCGVDGTWCTLSDTGLGGILLVCSLFIMMVALVLLVKSLGAIFKGPMAKAIQKVMSSHFPGKAKFLTGYVAILMGAGLTMLVQSSSVFTSTITPLVGMGLISVKRMFPLTLGANIGTCLTGLLAALTADPDRIRNTMQVALSHLFFNISGILLFYPVPFMRKLPINAAKFMGDTTAEYRWFAVAYIIVVFFLSPAAIFGLSLAGWEVLVGVLVPIGAVIIAIVVIKCMQHYCPLKMHPCMRNWHWLPKPLRSLEPCNSAVMKCCYNERCIRGRKNCRTCCNADDDEDMPRSNGSVGDERGHGQVNPTFQEDGLRAPQTPGMPLDNTENDYKTHL